MANKTAYRQRMACKGFAPQPVQVHRCAATGKIGYPSRHQAATQFHVLARSKVDKTRKNEVLQIFYCA